MLIEFRVTNYKSFCGEQTLSMVASSDSDLLDSTFTVDALPHQRLLTSAVIYGHNASGKSTLLKAMGTAAEIVVKSAKTTPTTKFPIQPFRLSREHSHLPTQFKFTFIQDGLQYVYSFRLDRKRVYEERLTASPRNTERVLFKRSLTETDEVYEWYFGPSYKGERTRLTKLTRPNVLFLSVAAQFNHRQLAPVYDWFAQLMALTPDEPYGDLMEAVDALRDEQSLHEKMQSLLRLADLGIDDVVIQEQHLSEDSLPKDMPEQLKTALKTLLGEEGNGKSYHVSMRHNCEHNDDLRFGIEDESRGTVRLMAVGTRLLQALKQGRVVIVDELDASLHPLLVKALVSLFHNPESNPHHAQLIFNTHDAALLDSKVFRRDQIWFVEKDNTGASRLYPLLDYSPRKGEALQKGYLEGRYGAIGIVDPVEWRLTLNGAQ